MSDCQFQCTLCETRFTLQIETVEDEVEACCPRCRSSKIFPIVVHGNLGDDCETCPAGKTKFIGGRCGGGKNC